jgi:hypothetical protein
LWKDQRPKVIAKELTDGDMADIARRSRPESMNREERDILSTGGDSRCGLLEAKSQSAISSAPLMKYGTFLGVNNGQVDTALNQVRVL